MQNFIYEGVFDLIIFLNAGIGNSDVIMDNIEKKYMYKDNYKEFIIWFLPDEFMTEKYLNDVINFYNVNIELLDKEEQILSEDDKVSLNNKIVDYTIKLESFKKQIKENTLEIMKIQKDIDVLTLFRNQSIEDRNVIYDFFATQIKYKGELRGGRLFFGYSFYKTLTLDDKIAAYKLISLNKGQRVNINQKGEKGRCYFYEKLSSWCDSRKNFSIVEKYNKGVSLENQLHVLDNRLRIPFTVTRNKDIIREVKGYSELWHFPLILNRDCDNMSIGELKRTLQCLFEVNDINCCIKDVKGCFKDRFASLSPFNDDVFMHSFIHVFMRGEGFFRLHRNYEMMNEYVVSWWTGKSLLKLKVLIED